MEMTARRESEDWDRTDIGESIVSVVLFTGDDVGSCLPDFAPSHDENRCSKEDI